MKLNQEVPFDEVVHAWLRAEWDKHARYRDYETYKDSLVTSPNFNNKQHNDDRASLLRVTRGGIVDRLPADTKWYLAEFEVQDIPNLFIIPSGDAHTPDWIPLTDGTFRIDVALKNIDKLVDSHAKQINQIYATLPNSAIDTKIIVIGRSEDSLHTIIEGNHRGVALIKHLKNHPNSKPILNKIYLGISPSMDSCIWHIEHPRIKLVS